MGTMMRLCDLEGAGAGAGAERRGEGRDGGKRRGEGRRGEERGGIIVFGSWGCIFLLFCTLQIVMMTILIMRL